MEIDITFKQKLIIIANFVFFCSFIATLIFRNIAFILFAIIFGLILIYIYMYYEKSTIKIKENMELESRTIINNSICIKPNKNNPFMNPNFVDTNNPNNDYKACNIDNPKIREEIDKYFKDPLYRDVKDIYERDFSQRQFYTMPSTTIPNDQTTFAHWLYHREKTCKENNGEQCFNNIM